VEGRRNTLRPCLVGDYPLLATDATWPEIPFRLERLPMIGPMPTLVTGATGFLGRHLVEVLLKRGHEVRALVRSQTHESALRARGIDVARGDVRDPVAVRNAATGCAVVFHLAGVLSYEPSDVHRVHSTNVGGTRALLEGSEPDARIVHVSSVAAVGPVRSRDERAAEEHVYDHRADRYVYPQAKRESERLALDAAAAGRDVVIANPGFLIGPGDVYGASTWPVRRYLQGTLRVLVEGGLSFVDARDVAAGLVALAELGRAGERTILTARLGNLSHEEFFHRVGEVTGVRRRQIVLPQTVASGAARLIPWPVKPGEARAAGNWWFYDPAKAERELAFTTRPLDESIADTAAQYK
jgi:nucleoside-diphosphate-sugar epimerase